MAVEVTCAGLGEVLRGEPVASGSAVFRDAAGMPVLFASVSLGADGEPVFRVTADPRVLGAWAGSGAPCRACPPA